MIQGMTNVATVLKSDEITNKDVKAAAVAAGDSAQALADFAKTVGDEPSAEQMTEAMDRYTTFTTSMSSLETVCTRADEQHQISCARVRALRVESEVGGAAHRPPLLRCS